MVVAFLVFLFSMKAKQKIKGSNNNKKDVTIMNKSENTQHVDALKAKAQAFYLKCIEKDEQLKAMRKENEEIKAALTKANETAKDLKALNFDLATALEVTI